MFWITPKQAKHGWAEDNDLAIKVQKNGVVKFSPRLSEEIFKNSNCVLIGQKKGSDKLYLKPNEDGFKLYKHSKNAYCIRAMFFDDNPMIDLGEYKVTKGENGYYVIEGKM